MKIEYRTGNLFHDPEAMFITHCCNSMYKMASGFAKELRQRYPGAYDAYMDEPALTMGKIIPHRAPDGKIIFNLIGQMHYGYDGKRYASYDAIADGLATLDCLAPDVEMDKLFMPLIGAGLAGGSWKIISALIEASCTKFQPIVYLLDGVVPDS